MNTEKPMRLGFVIPTGEYGGGLTAGVGLGILLTAALYFPGHRITNPLVYFGALGCIVIGSLLARAAQRKRFRNDVPGKKTSLLTECQGRPPLALAGSLSRFAYGPTVAQISTLSIQVALHEIEPQIEAEAEARLACWHVVERG
jgi:hypothetical protein